MKKGIFISIEGPIGVGKTTLTNILTSHFNATSLMEIVEENPFLSQFYKNIKEYALQTEAFFFFNRVKQLEDIEKVLKKGQIVVSDYNIIKNLIFAGLTLNKRQFYKYKQVYDIFVSGLPQSDIIIYLTSDTDTLMKKISLRDRSFERQMNRSYIDNLREEYEYYFNERSIKHYFGEKTPRIIKVDNTYLDFINNENDRQFIINKVQNEIELLGGK
ncbi:deoxyguanosine kinase [Alkalithermobacter thermoalcaliphilus JW-YL-7 = DSM 7308]|uniref:Deoxyguanosine kinase n=1 Tax=Alkalithermobacter thermoalcaliphilus JW-YL-7 = DSM 7308 TaxID=1121328 RepID=A0A150FPI9_CLOPD|nr:deoxynucleoside kinase [[Clostridium] paradoxum JW-YL-7 = DSM 7308]SHK90135.1 deoxyguanosine kinase [[Clostridium] paradoxum JW-YL-7 = DSM 7308]